MKSSKSHALTHLKMENRYLSRIPLVLATILMLRVFKYSWVTDDAFIGFRSVLQFNAGNGPVFNIGERVQSFTSPLWFFLLTATSYLGMNLYFSSVIIGTTLTLGTVILIFKIPSENSELRNLKISLALTILLFSEAFVSFSTSGLENALGHFLFTLSIYLTTRRHFSSSLFVLSLLLLTRIDYITVGLPLILLNVFFIKKQFNFKQISHLATLFLPLITWEVFSLIYYGFLFPNTFYAKVGGRSFFANAHSGVLYSIDFLLSNLLSVPLIIFVGFSILRFYLKPGKKSLEFEDLISLGLSMGVVLQFLYVVFISGGDFMSGRFYAIIILLMSILLLLNSRIFNWIFRQFALPRLMLTALLISCFGFLSAYVGNNGPSANNPIAPGVGNERNYYKSTLGMNLAPYSSYPFHPWAIDAQAIDKESAIGVLGVNGQRSYWIDLNTRLVDPVGLTDAFIARTRIIDSSRTGHFTHSIPEEYLQIKLNGFSPRVWNSKDSQELFQRISQVTEGPLFSWERLKSMIWMWKRYGI